MIEIVMENGRVRYATVWTRSANKFGAPSVLIMAWHILKTFPKKVKILPKKVKNFPIKNFPKNHKNFPKKRKNFPTKNFPKKRKIAPIKRKIVPK